MQNLSSIRQLAAELWTDSHTKVSFAVPLLTVLELHHLWRNDRKTPNQQRVKDWSIFCIRLGWIVKNVTIMRLTEFGVCLTLSRCPAGNTPTLDDILINCVKFPTGDWSLASTIYRYWRDTANQWTLQDTHPWNKNQRNIFQSHISPTDIWTLDLQNHNLSSG